ncbi:hypothetical protein QR680_002766 [Steinernema hermaphroditum]|uniref:Uncharacterized protein n=1 Tax=Steinernema hermaphroditum TaxID=289476 RepID=A0AA39H3Y9_9BILA|nr:hypothetical protein QR680_002766 [Steinernema hermaphroditum]
MPKEARPGIVQDVIAQANVYFTCNAWSTSGLRHGSYAITDEDNELPKGSHVPQQVEETAAPFRKESSTTTHEEQEFLLKAAAEVSAAARNIPAENFIAGKSDINVRLPQGYRVHLPVSAPQSLSGDSVERRVPSYRSGRLASFGQLSLGSETGAAAEITRRSFRVGKDDGSSTVERVVGPSNPPDSGQCEENCSNFVPTSTREWWTRERRLPDRS